jgi:hypothetical protein
MRTKLTDQVRRALAFDWRQSEHDVHFHNGAHGRAYVCDAFRCESPRLNAADVVGIDS